MFHLHPSHVRVLEFVRENPGCNKYAAAAAGTWHPLRNPSKQYYLVNTLIRHGYIVASQGRGNAYSLEVAK